MEDDARPVSPDDSTVTSENEDFPEVETEIPEEDLPLDGDKELNDQERIQLYDKAMKFKANHSYKHALLCFLGCMKGLDSSSSFPALPSCLQNIASIYAKFEDFPKAVQFMQAAKLYYETAIIGTKEVKGDDGYQTMDENAVEDDAKRANEYERLSHDCIKDQNFQLALEYCGKATHLRKKVYGDSHGVTIKSLDLFTMVYAEMGKLQYSEAIHKFNKKVTFEVEKELNTKQEVDHTVSQKSDDLSEGKDSKHEKEQKESAILSSEQEPDESITDSNRRSTIIFLSFKQLCILFILSIILAVVFTFCWCQYTENDACPSIDYLHQRSRFYYYFYVQSWLTDNKYI